MISHKYRCIFIHIPKCAGTSIERVFGHLDGHSGRGGQDHRTIRMIEKPFFTARIFYSKDNFKEFLRRVHFSFIKQENFRNKYSVTKRQYDTYFKFSIVRNPWSRVYSWYYKVMRDKIHLREYKLEKKIPFAEFVEKFAGKGMLQPQMHWLKNYEGVIACDYIARFEKLPEEYDYISRILHLNTALPHELKGSSQRLADVYDEKSIALIHEIYREEIDYFGYKF